MTAAAATPDVVVTGMTETERRALRMARIRGAIFVVLGIAALALAAGSFGTSAKFAFWVDKQGGQSLPIETTVGLLWALAGLVTAAVGVYQYLRGAAVRWRLWLVPILVLWVAATIAALLNGKTANLTGVFAGSLELATPLALGAFCGIVSERSGMFNIAIEGKFLVGACVAAVVASLSGNAIVGILGAMLACVAIGWLLAWLAIAFKVDQIITGTVVNIGALGITNFLYLRILGTNTELNTPPTIGPMYIDGISSLPIIGPIFLSGTPYLYITIALMFALTYMLFRTRWGLRLRACGEMPAAAGTVGIDVIKIRYRALLIAGAIAGFAGSYLSLASAGSFQMNMSAGKGFIALAAMIFGAWHPIAAFGAALVFGFADATQSLLSILGVDVPPQLLNSVPYLVTIIVVAGLVGRVRGPAASGQVYEQG